MSQARSPLPPPCCVSSVTMPALFAITPHSLSRLSLTKPPSPSPSVFAPTSPFVNLVNIRLLRPLPPPIAAATLARKTSFNLWPARPPALPGDQSVPWASSSRPIPLLLRIEFALNALLAPPTPITSRPPAVWPAHPAHLFPQAVQVPAVSMSARLAFLMLIAAPPRLALLVRMALLFPPTAVALAATSSAPWAPPTLTLIPAHRVAPAPTGPMPRYLARPAHAPCALLARLTTTSTAARPASLARPVPFPLLVFQAPAPPAHPASPTMT